jgi:hypothetical protein
VLTGSVVEVDAPMIVGAFTFFLAAAADSFALSVSTAQTSGKKTISELFLCPLKIKVYVQIYLFNIDVYIYILLIDYCYYFFIFLFFLVYIIYLFFYIFIY